MYELSLENFTSCGAHQKGHFLLSSGLHSGDYLQCALFLAYPQRAESSGCLLAGAIGAFPVAPEVVAAPAMGGLIIGHEVARALDRSFIFTERVGETMALRRGFAVRPRQKLVVIEDVVTTGTSTREVIHLLEQDGAEVVGVASLVNRSGRANPFDPLPYAALLAVDFATWSAADCPLCADGRPFDKPGSRPIS